MNNCYFCEYGLSEDIELTSTKLNVVNILL